MIPYAWFMQLEQPGAQTLFRDAEHFRALGYLPRTPDSMGNPDGLPIGFVKNQAKVDGLDVMSLTEGQQLRLGDALVAVTFPCEPCVQMDLVRDGLKKALKDRRGIFVEVVAPGAVRVGDSVELIRHDGNS